MTALVTDIQRFSLTDGPGIRTTVFLQGCNMRCPWCHNPETIPMKPVDLFYKEKCIGCGRCAEGCVAGARVKSSREMTVDDVMREIVQDKVYYAESGGGATISGGEPTLHPDFVAALADACRAEGVKVAIETNMSRPWQILRPLLERMDFIMCDLKLNLTIPHKEQTGLDNPTIFNSIGRASKLGIPMVVRTPLVPGVTDTVENLHSIAEYIAKMDNIVRYEVLNFNPLGGAKREALDVPNPFADAKPYNEEQLAAFRDALADIRGLEVKVG